MSFLDWCRERATVSDLSVIYIYLFIFIYLFVCSFICLFIHSFVRLFVHSFTANIVKNTMKNMLLFSYYLSSHKFKISYKPRKFCNSDVPSLKWLFLHDSVYAKCYHFGNQINNNRSQNGMLLGIFNVTVSFLITDGPVCSKWSGVSMDNLGKTTLHEFSTLPIITIVA